MKNLLFTIISLLILLMGCKESTTTTQPQDTKKNTLAGSVTDSSTGYRMPAVSISTIPATQQTLTDSTGKFSITDIPAGDYTVLAVRQSFDTAKVPVSVKPDSGATVAISLKYPASLPPAAPELLEPAQGSSVQMPLNFTWRRATAAERYTLEIAPDSLFASVFRRFADLQSTNLQIPILPINYTYYWRVVAANKNGYSVYSQERSFQFVGNPTTPIQVSPGNLSLNQPVNPVLLWKRVAKADSYTVQLAKDSALQNIILNLSGVTDSSVGLTKLDSGTVYYWRVCAQNSYGSSDFSSIFSFKTINPVPAVSRSKKRGLAYNLTNPADLDSLKRGVSWWYNWSIGSSAPAGYYAKYAMEFIPMLWGGNSSVDYTTVKNYILAHPEIKYLLVLNEPNLKDQANQTPAYAATQWLKYEQVIADLAAAGRTVYLVGPAITWGTMTNYTDPVVWLDAFYSAFKTANGRDPKIDYLAFHWYDYGLAAQLDRLKKYGKQIWVTEMANWNANINSYAKQIAQMKEMVNICETRNDVFRYAWFIGRGTTFDSKYTYIFTNNPGELTELGKTYLSLPFTP